MVVGTCSVSYRAGPKIFRNCSSALAEFSRRIVRGFLYGKVKETMRTAKRHLKKS